MSSLFAKLPTELRTEIFHLAITSSDSQHSSPIASGRYGERADPFWPSQQAITAANLVKVDRQTAADTKVVLKKVLCCKKQEQEHWNNETTIGLSSYDQDDGRDHYAKVNLLKEQMAESDDLQHDIDALEGSKQLARDLSTGRIMGDYITKHGDVMKIQWIRVHRDSTGVRCFLERDGLEDAAAKGEGTLESSDAAESNDAKVETTFDGFGE